MASALPDDVSPAARPVARASAGRRGDRKLAAGGAGSVTQANLQSRSPWDEYQASKDDAPMTRGTPQHHWPPAFQDSNEWDAGRMLAFGLLCSCW
jgi:hypothetical protein